MAEKQLLAEMQFIKELSASALRTVYSTRHSLEARKSHGNIIYKRDSHQERVSDVDEAQSIRALLQRSQTARA